MDVQSAANMEVLCNSIQPKNATAKKETTSQINVQIDVQVDIYEHTQPENKATYDKPGIKPDTKTLEQLMAESSNSYAHLKQIVSEMLKRQGLKFQDFGDIKPEDLKDVIVDEATQKEAQAMIAEGGEYSAAKVSDRIVDFAKAISGGDKSKLDLLKMAINKGFGAAEDAFDGKKLPEICNKTHQLIMSKLDDWAKEDETPDSQPADETNNTTLNNAGR